MALKKTACSQDSQSTLSVLNIFLGGKKIPILFLRIFSCIAYENDYIDFALSAPNIAHKNEKRL